MGRFAEMLKSRLRHGLTAHGESRGEAIDSRGIGRQGEKMSMPLIECYYNPASLDWNAAIEAAYERAGLRPGGAKVICHPKKEVHQNELFDVSSFQAQP